MQKLNSDDKSRFTQSLLRRGFVKSLLAGIGAIIFTRLNVSEATGDRGSATVARLGVPVPTYLPSGYRLQEIYTDRIDGFGTGSDEVALWYVALDHPMGYANPLAIYVAKSVQRNPFEKMPVQIGMPVVLTSSAGKTVQARYHDGIWTTVSNGLGDTVWNTSNAHSITFELEEYMIGIRGARLTGVSFDELIRIANSMSITATQ